MPFPSQFLLVAGCSLFSTEAWIFCLDYFSQFLLKVCKWQASMTFSCELLPFSQDHAHEPVIANVPCCESPLLFFKVMVKLAVRDDSNAIGNESCATARQWPPHRSYDIIACHENVYVNNYWQNKVTAAWEESLCLFCHATLTGMQHDLPLSLPRSGHLTWPQVKFRIWPLGGQTTCVAMRLHVMNTICYASHICFLGSKGFGESVDITKKQHHSLVCPGKVQIWPKVAKSGLVRLKHS